MKNNSLLIPLKINSNKENYNQNLYTQYTTNISSKRNNLHFSDPKKDYSSKTSKNKMLDLNSKVNDKNMKYEEYYTLNRNNNSKNNNDIARLNNDNKKQRIIKSNGTYKMNNKIINGKQNLENNNNIQNHQNLRNNHSFYESKYNKKNGNSVTINNILTNNSNKENLNLSNIIQPKNLTKKHIILNVDKISNNKNELTYQNTCKKPLTPIISISQEKRKAIMNSSYQTIQINNKNNKRVLNTTQNSVINRQINLKNNSIINDSKKRINQSKSSDIIGIIKTDSNIRNKNDNKYKIIELNKPLNSILKNSSVSPNNNIKNSIINTKNYPINHIFNKETLVIIPNNRNERESNITNINISQKNTYINSSTNKSNKILINNNLLYLSNNERKTESNTFKLNKKYFEHSPRFTEYMTINREKSYNTLLSLGKNNKSNENNSIPFKSNIFNVKENDQKKSENITIYSSTNNTKVLSKNINDKNKIIKFIPKTVKNNNNKINLREKTYLISPRNYDLSKKTIDTENSLQRNKNKSDLTILPQKAFVNPYIQNRINYIKSCKSISISGTTEEGFKKRNQDSFVIERNINGIYNFNIFGVLDGHGDDGHYVSQFVSRFIINSIKNNSIIKKCTTPKEIYEKIILNKYKLIENIFLDADMQIRKEKFDYKGSGTTCIIIIQLEEKIICANTGDSRAIIVYNKSSNKNNNKKNILENSKVFPLSYDCKPDLPNERKRIYEHGGVVEKALDEYDEEEEGPFRVYIKGEDYPGLAMSRSIGDIDAKKIGVIPNPQFIEYTINDETKYMIICSDGIWEFISNEEAMKIGNEYYLNNDPLGLCQCLYETSLDYWNEEGYSVDDITAIVVFF